MNNESSQHDADSASSSESNPAPPPKTVPPLHPHQRRVLGVLVEKAKTTPDSYPLTLNAIITGSNQKSNRDPQMNLDEDDVQIAMDGLRGLGAATEIQGSGRVNKFRHNAYDWLDVKGKHAAVMIELLLRGPQTLGEIRTRASRMEKIADLDVAGEVVNDLIEQGLVLALGRPGRGQQFTHNLYQPDELHWLKTKLNAAEAKQPGDSAPQLSTQSTNAAAKNLPSGKGDEFWQNQIDELKARVERLEKLLED